MQHLTKDILTTKVTKATKGSDIFDHKLHALRVLRGKNNFVSFSVAASRRPFVVNRFKGLGA
jgi:hypothetical protein